MHKGTTHDYEILKQEFLPTSDCFKDVTLNVDLGFQGIQNDYKTKGITIPHKRKRVKKGEKNDLTPEQIAFNKQASAQRVDVEHSIGQMKVCRIIHQVVRIRDKNVLNDIVLTTAALAKFKKLTH